MSEFSQTRSYNLGIAQETSVEAASIYDDLVYAQKVFGEGFFFRSYEQMEKRFPLWSERTIRRYIKKLEEQGWITTKVMKVNGTPLCHYKVVRFLSDKMTETMDSDKMADSINIETKEETKKTDTPKTKEFLISLISLVNPKEKPTDSRVSALNARLKDYTEVEITSAAKAFSKSVWHRENKQMTIDNLLAPSKFGRWFTAGQELKPGMIDDDNMTMAEREALLKERMG